MTGRADVSYLKPAAHPMASQDAMEQLQTAVWQIQVNDSEAFQATGFFVSTDGLFITNLHALAELIRITRRPLYRQLNLQKGVPIGQPVPFRLPMNGSLFNSETHERRSFLELHLAAQIVYIPPQPKGITLAKELGTFYSPRGDVKMFPQDVAIIQFPMHIEHPLQLADVAPQLNDPIFIAGYPSKTEDGSVDGRSLLFSLGQITAFNTLSFFASAKGRFGISGAPTLNLAGKVVGVVAGGRSDHSEHFSICQKWLENPH